MMAKTNIVIGWWARPRVVTIYPPYKGINVQQLYNHLMDIMDEPKHTPDECLVCFAYYDEHGMEFNLNDAVLILGTKKTHKVNNKILEELISLEDLRLFSMVEKMSSING